MLPFLADTVRIKVVGPARLIGPAATHIASGTSGIELKATGEAGAIRVRLATERSTDVKLELTAG